MNKPAWQLFACNCENDYIIWDFGFYLDRYFYQDVVKILAKIEMKIIAMPKSSLCKGIKEKPGKVDDSAVEAYNTPTIE